MLKAAFSPFSGGSDPYNGLNISSPVSFVDVVQSFKEKRKQAKLDHNSTYVQNESTGSFEASADSVDMSTLPVFDGRQANVPMMPPANSAANTPVFSPATQEKAASVYGTDNERQGAVSGFKQEAKDRIISELNNL